MRMGFLVETLSPLFAGAWRASWQAAVLAVVIWLLLKGCGRRLAPAWRYGLWTLVLIRLVLPWSFESPSSIYNWVRVDRALEGLTRNSARLSVAGWTAGRTFQRQREDITEVRTSPPDERVVPPESRLMSPVPVHLPGGKSVRLRVQGEVATFSPEGAGARGPTARAETLGRRGWYRGWLVVWLLGMVVVAARVAAETARLWRSISPARLVTDSTVLELLEDCRQLMRVRAPLVLVETDEVASPVLYGFLRPRLLVPNGMLSSLTHDEKRFVFLHELAHVRRHDIAWSWLMIALQTVHWFNPLVWLTTARLRAERELACDALALSCAREADAKPYGETILRLVTDYCQPRRLPAMAGIIDDSADLRARIVGIAGFRKATPSTTLAYGLFGLILAGALTDGRTSGWERDGFQVSSERLRWRAEAGVDLSRVLAQGEAVIYPEVDWSRAAADGLVKVGEVEGLAADTWQACSTIERPSPRSGHSTLWTGLEVLVWGGGATNQTYRDGAGYDPERGIWRPLAEAGAPAGRWQHAAVWTGTEMLVWGGRPEFLATDRFDDGARYDPQADRWKPMNSSGAPKARSQMAAVWTGRELIIWGGVGEGGKALADGARYDPVTDTWEDLPAGPLEGRWVPSAVWTGSELIIWGGYRQWPVAQAYADGAAYDPAARRWTLLPSLGAPRARSGHCGVWTGEEMIIWGGYDQATQTHLNSGARFNARTWQWLPLSLANAPAPRQVFAAAWSGSELIVWGGSFGPRQATDTGGRYEPATDTWRATTVSGAPPGRFFWRSDCGVWIGSGMFFFGGEDVRTETSLAWPYIWQPTHPVPVFRRMTSGQ